MHLQTQPTQVFTVFGSYVLEGIGNISHLRPIQ
jgi:hypothetical protein